MKFFRASSTTSPSFIGRYANQRYENKDGQPHAFLRRVVPFRGPRCLDFVEDARWNRHVGRVPMRRGDPVSIMESDATLVFRGEGSVLMRDWGCNPL